MGLLFGEKIISGPFSEYMFRMPTGYLIVCGFTAIKAGSVKEVGLPLVGTSASAVDFAVWNDRIVEGRHRPHELLGRGQIAGGELPPFPEGVEWIEGEEANETAIGLLGGRTVVLPKCKVAAVPEKSLHVAGGDRVWVGYQPPDGQIANITVTRETFVFDWEGLNETIGDDPPLTNGGNLGESEFNATGFGESIVSIDMLL